MSRQRGILGLKKDPKRQMLFTFNVREGDEWPSSDSEDSDYSPETSEKRASFPDSSSEDDNLSKRDPKSTTRRPKSDSSAKSSKPPQGKRAPRQKSNTAKTKRFKKSSSRTLTSSGSTSRSSRGEVQQRKGGGEPSVTAPDNTSLPPLPPELWLKIFHIFVKHHGPLPFLCRAARVSRCWSELAAQPSLWQNIDLSFGWIKSKDETLIWLARHRLFQCRELSLAGWKNVTNNAVKELCENCTHLEVINLSNCSKLTSASLSALVSTQPRLRELDLSFMSADAVSCQSLKQVAEKLGASLTSLVLAGNSLTAFHLVLNVIMDNCPNLDTLDLSNCRFSTDFLILNVEKLQACCPSLRVLRLANCKVRGNQVSRNVQAQATGFVRLHQLSCAMPVTDSPSFGTSGVPDNLLARLLHRAENLHLLDLRGCTNFNPDTLLSLPALNVEQLYLSQSSVSRYGHTLAPLLTMWRHSLKVVDLAWTSPAEEHMYAAIKTLTDLPTCAVTHLNLAGSSATLPAVRLALDGLRHLKSLDLTSCRSLPRGIKCLHEGPAALGKLKKSLQLLHCSSDSNTDSY